ARLQRALGGRIRRTLSIHGPSDAPLGARDMVLIGSPADSSDESGGDVVHLRGALDSGTTSSDGAGPHSLPGLAGEIARLHRYDGVRASFTRPRGRAGTGTKAYRDPDL